MAILKNPFFFVTFFVSFYPLVFADTGRISDIHVDSPTIQFGSRDNTETVVHEFILENRGTAPLEISKVKTSCGCTTARLKNQTLSPGSREILTARFSLRKRKGHQKKSITIHSNDPDTPKLDLFMEGEALPIIGVRPYSLRFSPGSASAPMTQTIVLQSEDGTPFQIQDISHQLSQLSIDTRTVTPGKSYQLIVTLSPQDEKPSLHDNLIIRTSHPKLPSITIPVSIRKKPDLVCAPPEIRIHKQSADTKTLSVFLAVQSPNGKAFAVKNVEAPLPQIQVKIDPVSVNLHRITLTQIPRDPALDRKNLVIQTTMDGGRTLLVPFRLVGTPRSSPQPKPEKSRGFLKAAVHKTQ